MNKFSRRKFLTSSLAIAAFAICPIVLSRKDSGEVKKLSIVDHHSNDSLKDVTFYEDGYYVQSGIEEISYLMRDKHTGEIKEIDLNLLEHLFMLKTRMAINEPFQMLSGFRSYKSNMKLVHKNGAAVKNSLHTKGQAIDLTMSHRNLIKTRNFALSKRIGGVGYYPKSHFIHIDSGTPRYWQG